MFSFAVRMTFIARIFTACACAGTLGVHAQVLQGHVADELAKGRELILFQAQGDAMRPYDSTFVSESGDFRFDRHFRATGFYQLGLNDTDRVNIILDEREPLVDLHFAALPLAGHVQVAASRENKRLQEMLFVLDETSAIREAVREAKARLQPTDTAQLLALDRVRARADSTQEQYLNGLVGDADNSYFAFTYVVDRAVQAAQGQGTMAVVKAINFSDPRLLRSTAYDKAIMVFLRNVHAMNEVQFVPAADTLMALAAGNADCRAHMLEYLVDLFATYGPELALQHMVDRYVVPADDSLAVSPRLRTAVEGLMRVSVGQTAPDVEINENGRRFPLSQLVKANRYTALFFYSSTCGHCHEQMPGLIDDRSQFLDRGFEVMGIALDTDSTEFLASIRENHIPWKCYSEFIGWGSKVAKAFQVKGTPAFYLLDQEMKIVAKPYNAGELGEVLRTLLP